MLAASTGQGMPEGIGVILGDRTEIEFRIEDFIHYYRHIKESFLAMQMAFSRTVSGRLYYRSKWIRPPAKVHIFSSFNPRR